METSCNSTNSTSVLARRLKRNKLKKKRIPRPLNAFFIFANKNRAKLKKMFPEKSNREISIELGQIWQKFTVVDRTPYHVESQKAVIQHKLKYPDYSYIPGSPKMKKKNVSIGLINFAKDINVPKINKDPNALLKGDCLSTNAINSPQLRKSEPTAQVQILNNTAEYQFEPCMKKQFESQTNNVPLRTRSTINIPQIHQFVNPNQLTVPNMSWVPWTPTWPYLPMAQSHPYRIFPTSTFNNTYPYMYNQQYFPGRGYLWPPSPPLSCYYTRDFQMNDNSALPLVNNQFSLENMNNNQIENYSQQKYYASPNRLNFEQPQQQNFSGINYSNQIETSSITLNAGVNYQPEENNEEEIQIDVITP